MLRKRARRVDKGKAAGTRSKTRKGPARDPEHLAKVREHLCLVASYSDLWVACMGPIEAHHVRSISPRSMGRRISDYLTAPLCRGHHTQFYCSAHGKEGEEAFWVYYKIDPRVFIRTFSEEGRQAIAELKTGVGNE